MTPGAACSLPPLVITKLTGGCPPDEAPGWTMHAAVPACLGPIKPGAWRLELVKLKFQGYPVLPVDTGMERTFEIDANR